MPIGNQKFADVAGVAGAPANLVGAGYGAGAAAAQLEHRIEQAMTGADGIAMLGTPTANGYFLVERITVIGAAALVTDPGVFVGVRSGNQSPGVADIRDAGQLVTIGDFAAVVFEFIQPLLVPGSGQLGVIGQPGVLVATAQYYVMG